jgi:hypothetical protein
LMGNYILGKLRNNYVLLADMYLIFIFTLNKLCKSNE